MAGCRAHTHALNSLHVIADLLISAIPLRLLHFYHAVIVAVTYVLFSLAFTFSADENIYELLDWLNDPDGTVLLCIIVVVVVSPLVWLFMYALYRIRLAVYNCSFGKTEQQAVSTQELDTKQARSQAEARRHVPHLDV